MGNQREDQTHLAAGETADRRSAAAELKGYFSKTVTAKLNSSGFLVGMSLPVFLSAFYDCLVLATTGRHFEEAYSVAGLPDSGLSSGNALWQTVQLLCNNDTAVRSFFLQRIGEVFPRLSQEEVVLCANMSLDWIYVNHYYWEQRYRESVCRSLSERFQALIRRHQRHNASSRSESELMEQYAEQSNAPWGFCKKLPFDWRDQYVQLCFEVAKKFVNWEFVGK